MTLAENRNAAAGLLAVSLLRTMMDGRPL